MILLIKGDKRDWLGMKGTDRVKETLRKGFRITEVKGQYDPLVKSRQQSQQWHASGMNMIIFF